MRLTIIPCDSRVVKNGVAHDVDLSNIHPLIHAIQWHDNWGEIEWKDERGRLVRNEEIESIEEYEWVLDLWQAQEDISQLSEQ